MFSQRQNPTPGNPLGPQRGRAGCSCPAGTGRRSPDVSDIGREANPHTGFGGGAHFCLGNHPAKLELRVLFEQLARRFPHHRQTGGRPAAALERHQREKALPVRLG